MRNVEITMNARVVTFRFGLTDISTEDFLARTHDEWLRDVGRFCPWSCPVEDKVDSGLAGKFFQVPPPAPGD